MKNLQMRLADIRKRYPWVFHGVSISIPVSAYLFFALWRLDLPGLMGDGVYTLTPVLDWIRKGNCNLLLAGYHGPVESFMAYPFLHFLGATGIMMRICPITYSVGTIISSYFLSLNLTRKYYVAMISTWLLSVSPTFVIATRVGMFNGVLMPFLFTNALLCFLAWHRRGKSFYFCLGSLFLGMAMGCRLWFLWYVVALAITIGILKREVFLKLIRRWGLFACGSLLFFSVSASPYVAQNIKSRLITVHKLAERLKPDRDYRYMASLKHRLRDFNMHLNGTAYFYIQVRPSVQKKLETGSNNSANMLLFWIAFCCVMFLKPFPRFSFSKPGQFLAFVILFTLLQSALLPRPRFNHLFALYPFPPMLIALFLWGLVEKFKNFTIRRAAWAMTIVFVLFISYKDFHVLGFYQSRLSETGGFGEFSTVLSDLGRYIKRRGFKTVYFPHFSESVMGWTILFNQWNIEMRDIESIESLEAVLEKEGGDAAFVKVYPWRNPRPYALSLALDRYSDAYHLKKVTFLSWSGKPLFDLYTKSKN